MKFLFLAFSLCLFSIGLHAQSLNCAQFKNGKFKSDFSGRIDIIERSDSVQTEFMISGKDTLRAILDVKWLDACTYVLSPSEAMLKKYPKLSKNSTVTVTITATSANSYTQNSKSNFSDKVLVSEMVRMH